jgi:hypothetical protein
MRAPENIIRLAAIAESAARAMAKAAAGATTVAPAAAGPALAKGKLLGPLGVKGNLLLAGGTAAAGMLGAHALRQGVRRLGRESQESTVFGAGGDGKGYALPFAVNAYGQPQLGTPLV